MTLVTLVKKPASVGSNTIVAGRARSTRVHLLARLQSGGVSVCEAGSSRAAFAADISGTDRGHARRGRRCDRIAKRGRDWLIRIKASNSLAPGRCATLVAGCETAERQ